MVPDKFNMVDMGGIDLILMQGEEVSGLYDRLVESIAQCRYQCLYNWLFDGVIIPPTYVEMEVNEEDEVAINEGITVSPDDVIHIYSLEPGPVDPKIIPLLAEENGVYNVPTGKDGFNPVTVDVPSYTPVINPITITENGTYTSPSGVDGYDPITVNVSGSSVIQADYTGPSYGFLYNNNYYGNPTIFASICYFEIPAGNYAIFQNDPVGNRFRFAFFSGKTFSDFENYIEEPSPNSLIYNSDFGYANDEHPNCRYLFTIAGTGVAVLTVNNSGSTDNSAILVKL